MFHQCKTVVHTYSSEGLRSNAAVSDIKTAELIYTFMPRIRITTNWEVANSKIGKNAADLIRTAKFTVLDRFLALVVYLVHTLACSA